MLGFSVASWFIVSRLCYIVLILNQLIKRRTSSIASFSLTLSPQFHMHRPYPTETVRVEESREYSTLCCNCNPFSKKG